MSSSYYFAIKPCIWGDVNSTSQRYQVKCSNSIFKPRIKSPLQDPKGSCWIMWSRPCQEKSQHELSFFLFFVFHNLQSTLKQELNDKNKYLQYILINNNLLTYLSWFQNMWKKKMIPPYSGIFIYSKKLRCWMVHSPKLTTT